MLHQINADMHSHAVALQELSKAFAVTMAIDVEKELYNLLEPPPR
jgi:hypothetical protein